MDENGENKLDHHLLIDLYLEGWLDDEAMAEVDYLLKTNEEFRKQVAITVALREQAEEEQHEEYSQKAVQAMLHTIAAERKPPVSWLRQFRQEYKWAINAIPVLIGLSFLLYLLYSTPSKPPITHKHSPIGRPNPDSSKQVHETNDQLARDIDIDTTRKDQHHQNIGKGSPTLIATKPIKVSLSDDLFGQAPDGTVNDTLTTQLYRITGRMEYEIRKDTLKLYLSEHTLSTNPKLSLSQQSDSTFRLMINKKSFILQHKGRHPLQ